MNELTRKNENLLDKIMTPTRAHISPADVLKLLETGDKTEAHIRRVLNLSGIQWKKLRAVMLHNWQIATISGKEKTYTALHIERTK